MRMCRCSLVRAGLPGHLRLTSPAWLAVVLRRLSRSIFIGSGILALASAGAGATGAGGPSEDGMTRQTKSHPPGKIRSHGGAVEALPRVRFEPVAYSMLDGWEDDDHLAALKAFARSCDKVLAATASGARIGRIPASPSQLHVCEEGKRALVAGATRKSARAFFEREFEPHRVVHEDGDGLLTGYYEPVIEGSRTRDARFTEPILRRPADLINLVGEAERGAKAQQLTHARKTDQGWEPFPTRKEIDQGALADQRLEFMYLRDSVDVFFMQVQGSGRIALPDGTSVRVTYDGKNGHPYTSIGQFLIKNDLFPADRMSLAALKRWLRANPKRMHEVLWQNASYVFFRELQGAEASAARGVLEIPLTPGRSLAVDTRFHVIGTPIYVSSQGLTHATPAKSGFHRLMIAQDVGSAIRGPERGDIFFGSGKKAGSIAGITKHRGHFFTFVPRAHTDDLLAEPGKTERTLRQAQQ